MWRDAYNASLTQVVMAMSYRECVTESGRCYQAVCDTVLFSDIGVNLCL